MLINAEALVGMVAVPYEPWAPAINGAGARTGAVVLSGLRRQQAAFFEIANIEAIVVA